LLYYVSENEIYDLIQKFDRRAWTDEYAIFHDPAPQLSSGV